MKQGRRKDQMNAKLIESLLDLFLHNNISVNKCDGYFLINITFLNVNIKLITNANNC